MRRPFRMIMLKQILSQIRTGDWFCSLDLKDAYFHIQIASHHRRFLRFAFEGVAYQYTVLPFRLSLAPRTFTKCMDPLSPLRQMGIRILNYLDDWLIVAQSEVELLSHRTLLLSHLERLGLRVNFAKSALSPSRRASFLGTVLDSAHMRAVIAPERTLAIQKLAATFKSGTARPLKVFQRMLGLMAAASPVLQLGPAPHAAPSTLVETTGSTQRMASRTPAHQGESGLCDSPDPLEEPTMDEEGRGHGVGLQQESCQLGGAVRRQTDLRPLVEGGERLPHQLLGNASSLSSLPVFPARPNRTPCADSLRQHVRGVLYKSPGRCLLEAPLHSGRAPSGMGSAQPALAEGSTPAGQIEPRSGYVISEQCPLGGVDDPSADGSEDLEDLWQGRSRPFRLQNSSHCPTYYSKDRDALAHNWPNLLLYAFPPITLLPQVIRHVREQGHKVLLVAPLWRNQPWLSELTQLLTAAPWPVPLRRDLLSQANGTIWHPRPELWALHLWLLDGSLPASQSEC